MKNTELLQVVLDTWSAAADVRLRRMRQKRYTYGDQWGDLTCDEEGNVTTEGEMLTATGRKPLTNNLIRRFIKLIVGRFRTDPATQQRYEGALRPIAQENMLAELDARLLEEFLISGMAIQRVQKTDCGAEVDNVSPDNFFVNTHTDPRGRDIRLIGMLHAMPLPELIARFSYGSTRRADELRRIFAGVAETVPFSASGHGHGFYTPTVNPGYCRLIEAWTYDATEERTGKDGLAITFGWKCRWLAPDGTVIARESAPSHPFALKLYPFTDGEVHSFVEDLIDQQRYVNRLIMLIDRIMGSAAKGVLLFPEYQLSEATDWQSVARSWASPEGIIPITGDGPMLPTQVCGNGSDVGAHKLLELEMKLFEDVSGVGNALLGKTTGGNGGQALFDAQLNAGAVALADMLAAFTSMLDKRDLLIAPTLRTAQTQQA